MKILLLSLSVVKDKSKTLRIFSQVLATVLRNFLYYFAFSMYINSLDGEYKMLS